MKKETPGPRRISLTEIEEIFKQRILGADELMADALARLAKVRKAKLKMDRRGQVEGAQKWGARDARVAVLREKIVINSNLISEAVAQAKRVRASAAASAPAPAKGKPKTDPKSQKRGN
jgi:hypothetical protein